MLLFFFFFFRKVEEFSMQVFLTQRDSFENYSKIHVEVDWNPVQNEF